MKRNNSEAEKTGERERERKGGRNALTHKSFSPKQFTREKQRNCKMGMLRVNEGGGHAPAAAYSSQGVEKVQIIKIEGKEKKRRKGKSGTEKAKET